MSTVYALIVGIDAYRAVPPLRGCRNDAAAALAYLRSRVGADDLHALTLHDERATRRAVIDGLRTHLGRARRGDTAVFWYAGHGSQAPVPENLWHLEPSGFMQTLVCVDSREGDVPDLYDKELSVLLDRVAANGPHVAAVVDSCHSAGVTRTIPEPAANARRVAPAQHRPRSGALIPELRTGWGALPGRSRLVALAACRSDQLANELPLDGGPPRGMFSWALLRALNHLGPRATYRELLASARCAVEDKVQLQTPRLVGDASADQPFLGGALRPPASGIVMRCLAGRWEIDAGSCHGVPAAEPGPLRVAVADDVPSRPARVVSVSVDRSSVEPEGWTPDPERLYPVVFTELPQPALIVAVDPYDDPAGLLAASPYLRVAGPSEPVVPDLRIDLREPGRARILGADGGRLVPDIVAGDAAQRARETVRAAEHVARWRQVHALTNPASPLAGGVRLEIVAARPGERTAPLDRPALRPCDDGLIRLEYRPGATGPVAPTVFIRLRNITDRPLYCVLLDLTDRYRVHAGLFPGDLVAARSSGAALSGRPVQFRLPAGDAPVPGRWIRDWLKLIVAEEEFSSRPFEQEALGGNTPRGVLHRVRMTRDVGAAEPDGTYDWATTSVGVVTVVPQ